MEKLTKKDPETKPRSRLKILAIFICTIILLIYVFSVNFLGYSFTLSFSPGVDAMPIIRTQAGGRWYSVGIAWPCAGVHSLFLYTLIILLLFKKSDISRFRKTVYFIAGAIGTYAVNILRIIVYFHILGNQGLDAAQTFHNVHAELLFVAWILIYILLIICIQKFRLVEKTTHGIQTLRNSLKFW